MRVAVIFFAEKNREKLLSLSKSLAKGIEAQGHQVDIIDGMRDVNTKLTIHQYIAVGTEALTAFKGRIPEKVSTYLANAGKVVGTRSFAYVIKTFFGTLKALDNLMKSMEKEGMFSRFSEIIQSNVDAEEIGKRLHIS